MILRSIKLIFALALLVLAWLLAFGNNQATSLSFMGWSTPTLPLFVWLFVTLFCGILVGVILGRLSGKKHTGR